MADTTNDNPDDEIAAMRAIVDALVPLTDDERSRVLRWAADRYNVTVRTSVASDG